MATFIRTPEPCFENLPGFDYKPHYIDLPSAQGLRLAYIDERTPDYTVSNPNSRVFLCLHGVPTWSYLYRKMIPVFLDSNNYDKCGIRVICPDFIGWGRSDKPLSITKHSIHNMMFHRKTIVELIEQLNLKNITLVVQDWGGLIGLTVPFIYKNNKNIQNNSQNNGFVARFKRLILFNTAIPNGLYPGPGFMAWRNFVSKTADMDVKRLIKGTLYPKFDKKLKNISDLSKEQVSTMVKEEWYVSQSELNAYNAPFPSQDYKYAVQTWPLNVPISQDYEGMDIWREAMAFWSQNREKGEKIMTELHNNYGKRTSNCSMDGFIQVFMAHGFQDPVFPHQVASQYMFKLMIPFSNQIDPNLGMSLHCGGILWVPYGGHFLQEQGGDYVARQALKYFGDLPYEPIEYEWCVSHVPKKSKNNKKDGNKVKMVAKCNILKLVLCNKRANTFDLPLLSSFNYLINKFDNNSFVRGYLLTSNFSNFTPKSRIFSAGFNLFEIAQNSNNFDNIKQYFVRVLETQHTLRKIKKPIIVGINGLNIAYSAIFCCVCDYRIMLNYGKDHRMIGLPESRDGMEIPLAGFKVMSRTCGVNNAAFIAQSGLIFNCEEALKLNLINEECVAPAPVNSYELFNSLKNEQALLLRCCNVLTNDYFRADMRAAAHHKYLSRREMFELFENREKIEEMAEDAALMFQSEGAKKHTQALLAKKSKL